jgi:dTDP-4-amino-4,6-dideoxygalactose transaminase
MGYEMDALMIIADKKHLFIVKDAAQDRMAGYKDSSLANAGHLGVDGVRASAYAALAA